MDQLSFASLDFAAKKKRTKRDVFLTEMAAVVPWGAGTTPAEEIPIGISGDACAIARLLGKTPNWQGWKASSRRLAKP